MNYTDLDAAAWEYMEATQARHAKPDDLVLLIAWQRALDAFSTLARSGARSADDHLNALIDAALQPPFDPDAILAVFAYLETEYDAS
jgi:hypothetical protein